MKLSLFDKGLQVRADPTLVAVDESVVCENVDGSSGLLRSINSYLMTTTAIGANFYLFNTNWYSSTNNRDYVEYIGNLYFTEAGASAQKVVGSTQSQLGISPPTTALVAVQGGAGALFGVSMPLPPGVVTGVSFSPDASMVAVASSAAPYLTLYKASGTSYVQLPNPTTLPAGGATGIQFSPSGQYLAVTCATAPYVIVYQVNTSLATPSFVAIAAPTTTPTGQGNGVSWSPDSTMVAVAHTTTPFVSIYTLASNVLTKIANPSTLPTGNGMGCTFGKQQTTFAVAHTTTPFVTIYTLSGTTFTKVTNPVTLPTGNCTGIDFSPDGTMVVAVGTVTPFIFPFTVSGSTVTALSTPAATPAGSAYAVQFSVDQAWLAVANDVSPYMTTYAVASTTFTANANPDVLPNGKCHACCWQPSPVTLMMGGEVSPFLNIYTNNSGTLTQYTNPTTLQYAYTYYDSLNGVESPPNNISVAIQIAAGTEVNLSGFMDSTNPAVDTIRLYRLGADTTVPILVASLASPGTTTYTDNTPTLDAPGNVLESLNFFPPPVGLQNLTLAYGTLFGTIGNQLYFNLPGQPDYWPPAQFIQFEYELTGILLCPDGLLVCSDRNVNILTGQNPSNFNSIPICQEHGSLSHKSGKVAGNFPVWVSSDGICQYKFGYITVVSEDKVGQLTLAPVNAAAYDTQYWVLLTDGSLFVMDRRYGRDSFRTYVFDQPITDIGKFDNVLYARVDGKVAVMFGGKPAKLHYRTGELTEQASSEEKSYNDIYVRYDGEFTVETYVNGKKVNHSHLSGSRIENIKPPAEYQSGDSIQFDIVGTGTLKEIEYKVEGRQNGR